MNVGVITIVDFGFIFYGQQRQAYCKKSTPILCISIASICFCAYVSQDLMALCKCFVISNPGAVCERWDLSGARNHQRLAIFYRPLLTGGAEIAVQWTIHKWTLTEEIAVGGQCPGFVSSRNAPERRSCSFFDHRNAVPVLFGIQLQNLINQ